MPPQRGDLWWCELPAIARRPVVVLSHHPAIARRRLAIVAPCTRTIRGLPTEVVLEPGDGPLPYVTAVNLDAIENVSVAMLTDFIGRLTDERMRRLCDALAVAVDCR